MGVMLCPFCPLSPVGVGRAGPRVRGMSELDMFLIGCITVESGPCVSPEQLSRAGSAG